MTLIGVPSPPVTPSSSDLAPPNPLRPLSLEKQVRSQAEWSLRHAITDYYLELTPENYVYANSLPTQKALQSIKTKFQYRINRAL